MDLLTLQPSYVTYFKKNYEIFSIGAVLVNENVDLPYLKNNKKKGKNPIVFPNLYTVAPDNLKAPTKPTFFGVELPDEEQVVQENPDEKTASEDEEDQEEFEQAKFFVTEAEQKKGQKKKKNKTSSQPLSQDEQEELEEVKDLYEGD